MIRKLYTLLLFFFIFINLSSGNIDLQTARKVADGFIKSKLSESGVLRTSSDFTFTESGNPVYYIVNLEPTGFIIVSACDAAPPILGYSLENKYMPTEQPSNFSTWLQGYSKMISYLTENNIQSTEGTRVQWESLLNTSSLKNGSDITTVGPLLTSTWNQGTPYNYLCPSDPTGPGGHVYAGCVATAMSQVMYYWRYPLQGTGSHGYTYPPYGYLFADFGNTTYRWEEMLNSTNAHNFEMAQLQSHLGISVDMMYSGNGSGAYSEDAAQALKDYFGYDQSLELVYMDDYAYDDWKLLLQAQIDAGQPMYYHGFGSGGHAFNVDGYQDTMYFHFNWGWGGSYNGYFHLFNLNPGGNNFTYGQGAIINFIPAGNNVLQCGQTDTLTMLAGTIEDGSGPVAPYFNNSACNWLILPGDTLENIKLTFDRFDLEEGKDFLYVYDGTGTDASLIGSYTGNQIPPVTSAVSGSMFIQFVTDGNGSSNGWSASYKANQAEFCYSGITTITARSGNLSDGSGSFNYRDKTLCKYKLVPDEAKSINITFYEFNTAGEGDFIEIYNLETQALLYKLYGQSNPGVLYFNTGELYIIFVSDQENTGTGWDFSYSSSEFTGLNEYNSVINATVFPNPVQNLLLVNISSLEKEFTLKLISPNGVTVYSEVLKSETGNINSSIDVSAYPRGIYILQVISPKIATNQKIVLY
jgi:hypothetical protein